MIKRSIYYAAILVLCIIIFQNFWGCKKSDKKVNEDVMELIEKEASKKDRLSLVSDSYDKHDQDNNAPEISGEEVIFETSQDNFNQQDEYFKIINRFSDKALDVNNIESSTKVYQNTWNGNIDKHWIITGIGNGYYKIVNRYSGNALTAMGIYSKSKVSQQLWDDQFDKHWKIEYLDNGYCKIINRQYGGVLDINNSGDDSDVFISHYNYRFDKQWKVEKIQKNELANDSILKIAFDK